jgi:hypothetical protein
LSLSQTETVQIVFTPSTSTSNLQRFEFRHLVHLSTSLSRVFDLHFLTESNQQSCR